MKQIENLSTHLKARRRLENKEYRTLIDEARSQANLKVSDLARLFGMPFRTAQSYCLGERSPSGWIEFLILNGINDYMDGKITLPKRDHISSRSVTKGYFYFLETLADIEKAQTEEEIFMAFFKFLKKYRKSKAKLLQTKK